MRCARESKVEEEIGDKEGDEMMRVSEDGMDVLLTQYEKVFRKNRKHEERRQRGGTKARKQGLIKREYVIVLYLAHF